MKAQARAPQALRRRAGTRINRPGEAARTCCRRAPVGLRRARSGGAGGAGGGGAHVAPFHPPRGEGTPGPALRPGRAHAAAAHAASAGRGRETAGRRHLLPPAGGGGCHRPQAGAGAAAPSRTTRRPAPPHGGARGPTPRPAGAGAARGPAASPAARGRECPPPEGCRRPADHSPVPAGAVGRVPGRRAPAALPHPRPVTATN